MSALVEAVQNGLEVGDIEYACYAAQDYCILQFFLGQNLNVSWQEQKQYFSLIQQKKQKFSIATASPWLQLVSNLLTDFSDRMGESITLDGDFFNEKAMVSELKENNDNISLFSIFFIKLYLNYLFYRDRSAVENGIEAEKVKAGSRGFIYYPVYLFYFSLALLAKYSNTNDREKEMIVDRVNSHQKQLEFWIENAPFTYQHKHDLVQAEYYRILDNKIEAINLYDRAIAGAKENEYIQEEALANELFAKFYLHWGRTKEAALYMQEAYYCYAQWGAKAKIDDLEKRYPQLLTPILQRQQLGGTLNSKMTSLSKGTVSYTNTSTGELLDLASLMKASRTLSQEIDLKDNIANFMEVIQENAGAETVALIIFQADTLMLTAHATKEEMSVISIPVETSNDVPLTLINHVKNTQEHLVLDNAKEDNDYSRDDYIQKNQPQSILCIPLIDRGQLIGILYLENNQTSGAFTGDRIEILNLLCSQAAIALQNAQLYDKEQLARNELQQALTHLQQAQLQLVQSEKMATLGNLVAGVAHEINNPVGFIGGNISPAQEYLQDLLSILSLYEENASLPESIAEQIEDLDSDFIAEDFPKLIASMEEGCNVIRNISKSLRTFSRTDTISKTEFNLHEGIDSTLLILKYRLKANGQRPAIEIVKKYGDIPAVKCYPGQLNQVFMNLLANAIDALDESNQGKIFQEIEKEPNQITIETELSGDNKQIIVRIADNGTGMPEEVKAKLFEQGFTTKGVGKGTGLGMAIAHQIVTEKHGGQISCNSTVGEGTIFQIVIPR